MKYLINIILSIFSVIFIVSCKEGKSRAEAQRRINESEITIYANNCPDIFQNNLKCYKIIDKEIKFNFSMKGSFFGCHKYSIFCSPQYVQSDPKIYTFTLK